MSENIKHKRKIKVIHLRDKCIGCGYCAAQCPKSWKIDEDGKATLKDSIKKKNEYHGEIDQQDYDENKDAEKGCPVNIIKVE